MRQQIDQLALDFKLHANIRVLPVSGTYIVFSLFPLVLILSLG